MSEKDDEKLISWMKKSPHPKPRPGLEERMIHRLRDSTQRKRSPFLFWGSLTGITTVIASAIVLLIVRDQMKPVEVKNRLADIDQLEKVAPAENELEAWKINANRKAPQQLNEKKSAVTLQNKDVAAKRLPFQEQAQASQIGSDVKFSAPLGFSAGAGAKQKEGFEKNVPALAARKLESRGGSERAEKELVFSEPRTYVVRDQKTWESLWPALNNGRGDAPVPSVDFSKQMILAVTLGQKPSPGYSVEITKQEWIESPSGTTLLVHYQTRDPNRGAIVMRGLTYPFVTKYVPVFDGRVEFTQDR